MGNTLEHNCAMHQSLSGSLQSINYISMATFDLDARRELVTLAIDNPMGVIMSASLH